MKCPTCHTHPAEGHPMYGVLPCVGCRTRQANLAGPHQLPEFTSESIKQQRREYANDIEQPHRGGKLNKRWVELYGEDAARKRGFSDAEIKSATYVYKGDDPANSYYKE